MQETTVFIVHLWVGQAPAEFRAAVLRAGSDESAWFTRADALSLYFEQQASVPAGARNDASGKEQP